MHLENKISEAKSRLDAWTREVIAWHFDPQTGCPFWLATCEKLDWDPRQSITCFNDLERFGEFQDQWLRNTPVRQWIPKGHRGKPVAVFETGGSTGAPKTRINIEDLHIDYQSFSETLHDGHFPKGSDWLLLGPTGPRRLRLAIDYLAQIREGICFCLDMDPRWVVRLVKKGRMEQLEDYKNHVIEQALTLLKSHATIACLFTTPKLLEALCAKVSLKSVGVKGVFCGGTHMTAQFHRFAREELLEGVAFVPTYGNTLMGLAYSKPFDPADQFRIIYYPNAPRAILQVVDKKDAKRVVPYGEKGRIRLTTLTKDFFMPNFLERDEAVREKPCEAYPWDGVGDVCPLAEHQSLVPEGVY